MQNYKIKVLLQHFMQRITNIIQLYPPAIIDICVEKPEKSYKIGFEIWFIVDQRRETNNGQALPFNVSMLA